MCKLNRSDAEVIRRVMVTAKKELEARRAVIARMKQEIRDIRRMTNAQRLAYEYAVSVDTVRRIGWGMVWPE